MKTPSGLSRRCTPAATPGRSGNVAHHVCRQDRVGAAMLGDDVVGKLAVEERADGADAMTARDFGDVRRRLDAEMAHAALP